MGVGSGGPLLDDATPDEQERDEGEDDSSSNPPGEADNEDKVDLGGGAGRIGVEGGACVGVLVLQAAHSCPAEATHVIMSCAVRAVAPDVALVLLEEVNDSLPGRVADRLLVRGDDGEAVGGLDGDAEVVPRDDLGGVEPCGQGVESRGALEEVGLAPIGAGWGSNGKFVGTDGKGGAEHVPRGAIVSLERVGVREAEEVAPNFVDVDSATVAVPRRSNEEILGGGDDGLAEKEHRLGGGIEGDQIANFGPGRAVVRATEAPDLAAGIQAIWSTNEDVGVLVHRESMDKSTKTIARHQEVGTENIRVSPTIRALFKNVYEIAIRSSHNNGCGPGCRLRNDRDRRTKEIIRIRRSKDGLLRPSTIRFLFKNMDATILRSTNNCKFCIKIN